MPDPSLEAPFGGDQMRTTHARWEIEHLADLARNGSLSAARELVRRAIAQCDQEPELYGAALTEWLKEFLGKAARNPRQQVGQLLAPRTKQLRPSSDVELVYSLSLSQEAYYRVRKAIEAGRPLKRAFNDVARELNALGYRNANQAPLRAASIERRYYEVHRAKRS
ncbi:MAG: hypothetical protein ACRD3G_14435 [Vicinamibacterales bacterium]